MSLESATYISQLQKQDPPGTDLVSEGDDHIRLIKKVLQNSFEPSIASPLIPEITDKAKHILTVNDAEDGIEWKDPTALPMGSNFFRYWKSAPQDVTSPQGMVRVSYDVMKEDVDNVWNASEWEIGVAGIYHIEAWWRIVEEAFVDHDIAIRVNGTVLKQLSYTDYNSGTTKFHSVQISSPVMCNAGDVIDIAAKTESTLTLSGSSNVLSGVTGYRLR